MDSLLHDPQCRDQILDDEALTWALLDHTPSIDVSLPCFFYILSRYSLRRYKVYDRQVADYVAALLSAQLPQAPDKPQLYVFDVLMEMQAANPYQNFELTVALANETLFIAGMFPSHLESRAHRRGAPRLRFYESMGQSHFLSAGQHTLAREHDLSALYTAIAKEFNSIRRALNYLSQNMVFL